MKAGRGFPKVFGPVFGQHPHLVLSLPLRGSIRPAKGHGPATFTRASGATWFDSDGILHDALADEPCFEGARFLGLDGNGKAIVSANDEAGVPLPGLLGLSVGPQVTNLSTYSEDVTFWGTTNATVASDPVVSPRGIANTGCLLKEDGTAASTHLAKSPAISFTAGSTYTMSVMAKRVTGTRNFVLRLSTSAFTDGSLFVDLGTGEVLNCTGAAILDFGVRTLGNGWFLLWITKTALATANHQGLWCNIASGTVMTYDGDGTSSIALFGGQVTATPTYAGYVPAGATTATRAMDQLTLPTADGINFRQAEGMTSCKLSTPWNAITLPANSSILSFRTTNQASLLYFPTTKGRVATSDSLTFPGRSEPAWIAYATNKWGVRWNAATPEYLVVGQTGLSVVSAYAGSYPVDNGLFRIANTNTKYPFYIRDLKIYNRDYGTTWLQEATA